MICSNQKYFRHARNLTLELVEQEGVWLCVLKAMQTGVPFYIFIGELDRYVEIDLYGPVNGELLHKVELTSDNYYSSDLYVGYICDALEIDVDELIKNQH